jgi:hypothetical protein
MLLFKNVEHVELDALTDFDAVPDGFPSAADLVAELRAIYADKLADGYRAYRVVFERAPEQS